MNYEQTQPGNPHHLTINQHILPRFCIERFANNQGKVRLTTKDRKNSWESPKAKVFCAARKWDQINEAKYMHEIEEAYKTVSEKYLSTTGVLNDQECEAVSRMYWLWKFRFDHRNAAHERIKLNGISGDSSMSKDMEETLEAAGVVAVASDGTITPRHFVGDEIMRSVDLLNASKPLVWTCHHLSEGNLIVPDNPGKFAYMPLAPQKAFTALTDATPTADELNARAKEAQFAFHFQFAEKT